MATYEVTADLQIQDGATKRTLNVEDLQQGGVALEATQVAVLEALNTLVAQGAGAYFTYVQQTPSDLWVVDHPLNRRPAVVVVDTAGTLVHGEVNYVTLNRVELIFSAPFSGTAHLV